MTEFSEPFPSSSKRRHKILASRILLKSILYAFAIFGILFILLLLVVLGMLRQETGVTVSVPNKALLTVDFDEAFQETRGSNLLTELSETPPQAFYDLVKAVNLAAEDKRIKILLARIGNSPLGLAQIEDLREAVLNFRRSGKKAYIHSAGFGTFGGGSSEYYLATAFDKIIMQPDTEVGITGIDIEVPFFKNVLKKIGVETEFYTRYEFKTAVASFQNNSFSPQFKAELEKIGKSVFARIVTGMSTGRNLEEAKIKELINQAPLLSIEAKTAGLIDEEAYYQDLLTALKKETDSKEFKINGYIENIRDGKKGLPAVAFLVIDGVIAEGKSSNNPLSSEPVAGADSVLKQIEKIADNKDVKAVVVRINSPGGSYTASNQIRHALMKLKQEKKLPLMVSMGDFAASGGYFVALVGDKIVAEPLTITGSIGVLGGKVVLQDLWQKIGVTWGEIKFGDNAGILSTNHRFSEKEKRIFNKSLDNVYRDFTLKVSEARHIPFSEMDKLARGRIWTGEDAVKLNLVDELGGIEQALYLAKEAAGIKAGEPFSIHYYPKPKSLQQKISEMLNGGFSAEGSRVISRLGLDINDMSMLQRLQYKMVLPPFKMNF